MNNDEYSHWLYHNISQSMNKYLCILICHIFSDVMIFDMFDIFWGRNVETSSDWRLTEGDVGLPIFDDEVQHHLRQGRPVTCPQMWILEHFQDRNQVLNVEQPQWKSWIFWILISHLSFFQIWLTSKTISLQICSERHVSNTFTLKQLQSSRKINFQIFQKSQTHYIYRHINIFFLKPDKYQLLVPNKNTQREPPRHCRPNSWATGFSGKSSCAWDALVDNAVTWFWRRQLDQSIAVP